MPPQRSVRKARLAESLAQARADAGLTQAELSVLLGRTQSYVSKYEGGRSGLDVLEFLEITEALGCPPEAILRSVRAVPRRRGARLPQKIGFRSD